MGLDMYSFATKLNPEDEGFEDSLIQIGYWRKANFLHGWFAERWAEQKPGRDPADFNCEYLEITPDMHKQLGDDLRNNKLKPVDGFFFGAQVIDPGDLAVTWAWHMSAFMNMHHGYKIYYQPSW